MSYQGTTGNNNQTTIEGAMASSSTTSGSNINYEDHVTIFVAYNGLWEYDGKEWLFKNSINSRSSIMVVPKHITLSEIIDKLNKQFKVNTQLYHLKLEVHYRTGIPWFPVTEIQNNEDLSVFISETSRAKLPLCVTRLNNAYEHVVGERQKDDTVENRLMNAIQKDDWAKAREIVNTGEVTWTTKLDDEGNTSFHFAVGEYRDDEVVRDILMINNELLVTTVNNDGQNPAHVAARFGNTEALKIMLEYNPICLFIADMCCHDLAINYALKIPHLETFGYLFKQMQNYKDEFDTFLRSKSKSALKLLGQVIDTGLIDVAYELINDYPTMATQVYDDITPLERIIRKPHLFYSGANYNMYKRFIYRNVPIKNYSWGSFNATDEENQETPTYQARDVSHVKDIKDIKVKRNKTIKLLKRICEEVDRTNTSSEIQRLYSAPFCLAVENNIPEAIDVLTTYFPQLYASEKDGKNIFQLTVLNRSEMVYSYLVNNTRHAKFGFLISVDDDGNSIAHLAARLSPIHKITYLPALQMQREFDWLREAKRVVGPALRNALNKNGETPEMVFRKEHKQLRKDAEEWMKKTADSYTITAALIITITFAAAITVPGGNNDKTGIPIYEMKPSFITFVFAVATSMFTATASLLSFLYILTASYNSDVNFLFQLPTKLINGLALLSVSLISMMIAFSAALYIMFGHDRSLILILIGELAWLPIASFMTIQIPLLVEFISSTYCAGIFAKKKYYWESSANANKKKRT